VLQVGYLQEVNRDARPTKHKKNIKKDIHLFFPTGDEGRKPNCSSVFK